jgi:hypothetical protein
LLLVGSISVTPESVATESGGGLNRLSARIGAATYLVPSETGLTGGATAQGPAGTTPAATPSDTPPASDGGTDSSAAATITGAAQ